ncbi:MAG: M14 family zinc carboxypeptidase [Promethearchaeota archaeon]
MRFKDLSSLTKAKEVIIGKTVQGRNIVAYEYGNINSKPTILIISGFHPPERDTVAIEAIMEKLLEMEWRERALKNYSFSLIPILNPDGFANSMQGSNINEINFHWKFFGNDKDKCPEAYSIWEYCKKIKPVVLFDFHAFTFQNNNPRPYLIPEGYYVAKKSRLIQKYFNSKLSALCGLSKNRYSRNEVILAPTLLATRLRNEFGTLTVPKFHLHMKDGIEESKQMALKCLEIILRGLRRFDVKNSGEILKIPYGEIRTTIIGKLRIKLLNFWFFYLISSLKTIYKIKI